MTQAIALSNPETKPDSFLPIETLIITVGTRQIGWRGEDGIVRCFGTDGDRGDPSHTQQLYDLLNDVKRDFHDPSDRDSKWKVRDLGERFYKYALENSDFDRVELLMDEKIIHDYAARGMKHIILWATNQPETTSWRFRRDDTVWLAELMAKKIELLKQQYQWQELQISIVKPIINAGNSNEIRQAFATEILPLATKNISDLSEENDFVLGIENTGSVPAMSESLAISTAALIRQFAIVNLKPTLPKPMYHGDLEARTAIKCSEYIEVLVSDYFWSLEKAKIVSAWKRGDFNEARIWLTPHQHKYEGLLYHLAEKLTLCNNGEFYPFVRYKKKGIESWIEAAENSSYNNGGLPSPLWKRVLKKAQIEGTSLVYESSFSIYLLLERENYTNAFRLFTQTIERLLYAECEQNDWIRRGIVKTEKNYPPRFVDLIEGWLKSKSLNRKQKKKWDKVLNDIRHIRNKIVHEAKPLQPEEILKIWNNSQLKEFKHLNSQEDLSTIYEGMKIIMSQIYQQTDKTLFESLYRWGLETLERD